MTIDVETTLAQIGEVLSRNGIPKGSFSLTLTLPDQTELSKQSLDDVARNVEPMWSCRFVPPLGFECNF